MEEEARRMKRSKSSIVEELAEEAAKTRRFPGIVFQGGGVLERRAHVVGTGLDVWQLCWTIDNYGSIEAVVEDFPKVTARHCELALAYRRAYPDEVNRMIAANNRPAEEWQALYPFIEWRAGEPRS
jgi:uncharacterized protein (DUF433 family)